jgi:3-methylfumaryl-CoA hydratase
MVPASLQDWIGRNERRSDWISAGPFAALAATLDREDPEPVLGSDLPQLGHWLLFRPTARQSALGTDGHRFEGGFLPPAPLPRRMWAGGRVQFHHALHIGDEVSRSSCVVSVDRKTGRGGSLIFVTVRHEIHDARGIAVTEEQDIVYREAPPRSGAAEVAAQPAPLDAAFEREIRPDPVLLFRYSALTFNGHRIHYDRRYATEVEGYPGLVVHGPLIATMLLDLLRRERPDAAASRFSFRAVRPLFDTHCFTICGRPDGIQGFELWAHDHEGYLAMQARAELAQHRT